MREEEGNKECGRAPAHRRREKPGDEGSSCRASSRLIVHLAGVRGNSPKFCVRCGMDVNEGRNIQEQLLQVKDGRLQSLP